MAVTAILNRSFGALAFVAVTASLGWLGCGESHKQVAMPAAGTEKDAGLAGSGETGCKSKSECKPAAADISATFAPSGALLGFVNTAVNWEFYGVDKNTVNPDAQTSARKIMVLLDKIPEGAAASPGKDSSQLDPHVVITWTPTKKYSGKSMDVILRDYDRCVVHLSDSECNSYSFMKEYDTKQSVPWEIADQSELEAQANQFGGGAGAGAGAGNVVNVANPNCGNPTSKAQITTSLFTTGLGVLLNPKSIITMVPSLLGGLTGGAATPPPPTQC